MASLVALALAGPPALATLFLAVTRPEDAGPLYAGALAAGIAGLAWLSRCSAPRAPQWLLAGASLALCLWPETCLRVSGFRFDRAGVIEFGYPRPEKMREARRDPDLFWTLDPKIEGVNSAGFSGPEVGIPKPPGTRRVVFFGDSVVRYPPLVALALNSLPGANGRFEVQSLAISGYSSYQGTVLAKRFGARFEPDVAVIQYGWNDHWQAYGATDSEKGGSAAFALLERALPYSRTVQWALQRHGAMDSQPLARPRVSLPEYEANLEFMADTLSAAGSELLFVTAPSTYARFGVPDYVVERGFVTHREQAVTLHHGYNEGLRRVAHARGAALLDLAEEADAREDLGTLFSEDGIHLTSEGLTWMAQRVAMALVEWTRLAEGLPLQRGGPAAAEPSPAEPVQGS